MRMHGSVTSDVTIGAMSYQLEALFIAYEALIGRTMLTWNALFVICICIVCAWLVKNIAI